MGLLALVPSAVLDTESPLKCPGWRERQPWQGYCRRKGTGHRQLQGRSETSWLVLQGKEAMWWHNPEVLECQGAVSSCGLWGASQKLEAQDRMRFIVFYQGQPGLIVVAGWLEADSRETREKAAGQC